MCVDYKEIFSSSCDTTVSNLKVATSSTSALCPGPIRIQKTGDI